MSFPEYEEFINTFAFDSSNHPSAYGLRLGDLYGIVFTVVLNFSEDCIKFFRIFTIAITNKQLLGIIDIEEMFQLAGFLKHPFWCRFIVDAGNMDFTSANIYEEQHKYCL